MSEIARKRTPWPFAIAVLCLAYDNKWVLFVLVWLQAPSVLYYGIPMLSAPLELIYWRWFFPWFTKWLKDEEALVRETYRQFWAQFGRRIVGLAMDIWHWVLDFLKKLTDEEGHLKSRKGRFAYWVLRTFARPAGYPLLIILGIVPFGWVVGVPIALNRHLPYGFHLMLASCVASNWIVAYVGRGPLTFLFQWLGLI